MLVSYDNSEKQGDDGLTPYALSEALLPCQG